MILWILIAVLAAVLLVALAGSLYERIAERADRKRFPPPGRVIDIGHRGLHGLIRGTGPGPMLVIEQGLASPSSAWWPVQEAAAAFARVCAYDRAGYLWSDPGRGGRSIEDRAADLHAWLAACGVPPPYVLVAHSFGGLVAQAYIRAWPSEVAGLVLVDTLDAPVMFREASLRFLRQGVVFQRIVLAAARVGLVRLLGPRAPVLVPDDPAGRALSLRPCHTAAVLDDMRCILNASPAARQSLPPGCLGERPVLVLTHGVAFPPPADVLEEGWSEAQQRLAALSSNSEVLVVAKANHFIHVEAPGEVVEAMRRVHAAATHGTPLAATLPGPTAVPSPA